MTCPDRLSQTLLLVAASFLLACREADHVTSPPLPEPSAGQAAIEGTDFIVVSAGRLHTCGLIRTGQAYCWGSNLVGELGTGASGGESQIPVAVAPPVGSATPVSFTGISATGNHTCGVTKEGSLYCWGSNQFGKLGNGDDTGPELCDGTSVCGTRPSLVVAPTTGAVKWTSVSAGTTITCAVSKGDAGYCWGNNFSGQVGNPVVVGTTATPVPVFGGYSFASLSAGGFFACGLTTGGQVLCWGDGGSGQLGNGSSSSTSPVPVAVASALNFTALDAASAHTCAVSRGGAAYCWGNGFEGQVGNGIIGAALAPVAVAPPFGSTTPLAVSSIGAGDAHSCAISKGGEAYCWGRNDEGQLGLGTFAGLESCSTFICSTIPRLVAGGFTFSSVAPGGKQTCAISKGSGVYCWGDDSDGQLGNGAIGSINAPGPVSPFAP